MLDENKRNEKHNFVLVLKSLLTICIVEERVRTTTTLQSVLFLYKNIEIKNNLLFSFVKQTKV